MKVNWKDQQAGAMPAMDDRTGWDQAEAMPAAAEHAGQLDAGEASAVDDCAGQARAGEATVQDRSRADDAAAPSDAPARTFTQAEVDRLIRQRLARAQRDHEARVEAARAEGERLAQMTGEERLRHDRDQLEQAARERTAALDAREVELTRRELRAEAAGLLAGRSLPGELRELLDYSDADAMSASLDRLERVYRAAVQSGVDARLSRGGVQLAAHARPDPAALDDAEYYASVMK